MVTEELARPVCWGVGSSSYQAAVQEGRVNRPGFVALKHPGSNIVCYVNVVPGLQRGGASTTSPSEVPVEQDHPWQFFPKDQERKYLPGIAKDGSPIFSSPAVSPRV